MLRPAAVRPVRRALLVLAVVLTGAPGSAARGLPSDDPVPSLKRGMQLFESNCAVCHGPQGHADGPVTTLLDPQPRDFGSARFKIVSTANSLPHDEDLLTVIRDGMPGSAMPAFGHLPRRDLLELVTAVRHSLLETRIALMLDKGGGSREEAIEDALELLDPGDRASLPPEPRRSPESLLRGREVFLAVCAHCHDADGTGRSRDDLRDTEGRSLEARDFTRGVFKGGADAQDLARRILLGMPGTPMPAVRLADDDLWAVVHYVQSLIEPGAQERVRQQRETIVALRVPDRLDDHSHEADWDRAPEVDVALMPMAWRRERPETLHVRALHDGRHLALRLRWDDPVRDDGSGDEGPDDGVAVEVSGSIDPPFFGMGSQTDPVTILNWRASWQKALPNAWTSRPVLGPDLPGDVGGGGWRSDLTPPPPATGRDAAHWPVLTSAGSGPGHIHPWAAPRADARARGLRSADGWDVILSHRLVDADGFALVKPGQVASLAFAVWDGGAGDVGGSKSISIWQHLLLEE